MFSFKIFYIVISSLLLFLLASCFIESIRKKTKLFTVIANVQICSILTIAFTLYAINIRNNRLAQTFYALSYVVLFIAIIVILRLVMILGEKKDKHKSEKIGRYVFYCISLVNLIFMLIKPDYYFFITPSYKNDNFYSWIVHYNKFMYIYLGLTYVFSLKILIDLIIGCVTNYKLIRRKYVIFLGLFVFEQISQISLNFNISYFNFDYTPLICGAISIYAFYFAAFQVPKQARDNMLAVASETISDAVIFFDYRGNCLYANKKAREIYTPGKSLWINKYLNASDDYIKCDEKMDLDDETHTFKVEFKRLYDRQKKYSGAYIKLNDVTLELKEITQEAYRATHDELTGLANRVSFFNKCDEIIKQNPEIPRYMIASNIKNFKIINDLFGTQFGDNILKRQADMFRRANYTNCIKGRVSGDKFAMLISKKNFNPELAIKNTDFVQEYGQNVSFPITIQLGVYEVANPTEKAYTMYNKALLALKNTKDTTSIRNTISFYDTSLTNRILYEQNIIGEFHHALKNDNFHIFIQAQVDSKSEKCAGGEALVRWYDPESLYRQPGEFIEILEKSGLIYKLDYYVWENAAKLLSKWKHAGHEDFYVSVNISAKDFYYTDLYKVFTGLIEKYDISPANYNLELTESAVIDKNSPHKNVIKRLRDYGFKIEMDDFGSGYSSLNVLKEIEMDVLKIDMEFLHTSDNEERGKSIIVSIVKMAKSLGMKVVAEGVETLEQKDFLAKIGVDLFQGYYFSKPIEVAEFEAKYLGGTI